MEEEQQEKKPISENKLKKLRNLRYFRDWSDEQIQEWYRFRHGDDEKPPETPPVIGEAERKQQEESPQPEPGFDEAEYKKKYNSYINRYKKEYAVDMNETNDVEALQALVRYMIQLERANELIMKEQSSKSADHRILKGLGDFQRSIQMNVNELQDKLGISRKQRKEKQHDDIPQYITALKQKAKTFWEGKTVPVRCETCKIELARYWLNFPGDIEINGKMTKLTEKVQFNFTCYKCHQKVTYAT